MGQTLCSGEDTAQEDPSAPIRITLMTVDGSVFLLENISQSSTGLQLRTQIEQSRFGSTDWPVMEQRLVYDGRELDNDGSLVSQGLNINSTVYLLRRKVEHIEEPTANTEWDFRLCARESCH